MTQNQSEPSVAELLGNLASQTTHLVRQEVRLATGELTTKAKLLAREARVIAVGALLAVLALQALIVGAVIGLSFVVPVWAAVLIVVGVFALGASIGIMRGIAALRRLAVLPSPTLISLSENKSWLTNQFH